MAGVQISIDILPTGKRAELAQQTAAKQKIDARLTASQQHVRLEVSQAHIHRRTAKLSLETAQAALDQSAESLRILKNRYGAGLANITSAQVVGRIQQVLVREGDSVRAGQTLAVLDDAALRASVDQAQAGLKAAQQQQVAAQTDAKLAASTLDRYRQLQADKSVSPQEMDEVAQRAAAASARFEAVRSQTDAARAQEAGTHTMLGYTHLVAPFAGVVTARRPIRGRWLRRAFLCFRSIRPERCNCKLRWMSRRSPPSTRV